MTNNQRFYSAFILGLVVGFVTGYFVGREHVNYEIRSTMTNALSDIGKVFGGGSIQEPKGQPVSVFDAKEKQDYIEKSLSLYELKTDYYKDAYEGTYPVVHGKIKNIGNRTLTKVEVTAYFQDGSGNTVYENSYRPVMAGALASVNIPLKPNYIKEFSFKTNNVPSESLAGQVIVSITDIEFEGK